MRVLIFAPNYFPATRYGGPVRSAHGLARGLIGLGHEVCVYTTDVDGAGRLDVPLARPTEYEGVPVVYFPVSTPRRLYYSPPMRSVARKAITDYDVVHLNGIYLWPGQMLARLAKRSDVPSVLSPRGMLGAEMIAGKSARVKKTWIAIAERFTIENAAAIHATSSAEAREVERLVQGSGRIAVIGNGVDVPSDRPDAASIERLWAGIEPGRRVALVGRIDWTKGIDLAIAAVRSFPGAQILIAGPDQIGLRAQLEPALVRGDGSVAGCFVGELEDAQKWALLAGADVLLAPSVRESFSMAVAEALAIGTPVVCTTGVGARSIVEALDPLSVVERHEGAIASALARLLGDAALRDDYGARARRLMAEAHSWSAVAGRMVDLYRSAGAAG